MTIRGSNKNNENSTSVTPKREGEVGFQPEASSLLQGWLLNPQRARRDPSHPLTCVCVCVCVRPCVRVPLGHSCVIKVNELKLDAQRCRSSRCAKRRLCIRTKRWYICLHFLVLFLFGFHKYSMLVVQVFREGNGNPLQYFCLENPMDGGAW